MVRVDSYTELRAKVRIVRAVQLFGGGEGLTYEDISIITRKPAVQIAALVGSLVWDTVLEMDRTGSFRSAKCRLRNAASFLTEACKALRTH